MILCNVSLGLVHVLELLLRSEVDEVDGGAWTGDDAWGGEGAMGDGGGPLLANGSPKLTVEVLCGHCRRRQPRDHVACGYCEQCC